MRIIKEWTQPVLSANGTLGGASFAVSADTATSGHDAYAAFDGDTTTYWRCDTSAGYLIVYNPIPLKITAIHLAPLITSGFVYGTPSAGSILGSDDGTTWTKLDDFTNTGAGAMTMKTCGYYG